jgi:hypothetical protein
VDTPSSSPCRADFAAETTHSPRKRTRKTSQLPQFRVYEDQTLVADRTKNSGQNESPPSLIGRQLNKIWPHISVDIPFNLKFHSFSVESTPRRDTRQPLASLSSIALNDTKRAPKIPQEWLKNQPNDHTSTFFSVF